MATIASLSETVTVYTVSQVGYDELGAPVFAEDDPPKSVGGVLVVPGSQGEPNAQNRPDGAVIAYTLYFPKEFTGDVDGLEVGVRGRRCRVVGHPDRYRVPGFMDYNMKCEVSHVEG